MAADDETGLTRGVAGRPHAFNRYEIKYLVANEDVPAIRSEPARRMDRDEHSPPGGYGVWSLSYDTPALRFYWEKIEGLKFRRKLRIRHYGELARSPTTARSSSRPNSA